ncbi:sugar ABC transporter substrate-binding protein [Microbacterium sp. No. 7]|uniref:sugar ABC transporter substrate-binding protein n=1 Tax=Microbacterium sp. No. 7 TaxID=1714373 RepID=UPI0006D1C57A|nr:substrate-binding domain-containing protein [Microbacterium sp. No. 7]ALJ19353.1 hypothetical protein AOA12_05305 [Microbacterium sp. No. 7]
MKMKKKVLATLGLMASAAFVMAGCTVGDTGTTGGDQGAGGGESSSNAVFGPSQQIELFEMIDKVDASMEGKRVVFVPILFAGYTLIENWYQSIYLTLTAQGAEVSVIDPNFDTDALVKAVDDVIAKKSADILIVQNPDVGVLQNQIQAAADAGIYTILMNMASNTMGDALIAANQFQAGKDIAERVIADCEAAGGGKAIQLIYGPGNDAVSMQWENAIREVVEPAGFTVRTTSTAWQQSEAQEAASNAIQQYKGELCAIMPAFDLNSIPVGDEVAAAVARGDLAPGEVGVYTFGGDALWCDSLRAGKVTATAAYSVDGLGTAAAAMAQALVQRGEPAGSTPTVAWVPHTIVDATNVDQVSFACYQGLAPGVLD